MVSKQNCLPQMDIEKNHLPANCLNSATHIHWMEETNFERKYHDVKVKSLKIKLKQWSTLQCISSYNKEKKN